MDFLIGGAGTTGSALDIAVGAIAGSTIGSEIDSIGDTIARHDAMILWFLGSLIVFLLGWPQAWCIVKLLRKFGISFRTCFPRVMDLGSINCRRI